MIKQLLKYFENKIGKLYNLLPGKQFLIVSAILVGISTGLAAVFLKTLVHYIQKLLTFNYNVPFQYYLYLIFPVLGILATVFYVRRFNNGKLGRGAANILYAIAKKSSVLPRDQMYSHIFSSALTVGFGGSAGLESPIVTTGSAIGSNFARTYRIPYKERTLLLASGAAAGIGAMFNAPIAGVLFALEVLLVDINITAFIPLLIAAATGALCSKIILDEQILLLFELQQPFHYFDLPFYMFLGILCGFVSVYYVRTFMWVEKKIPYGEDEPYKRALSGGLLLAILVMLFPPLFGEGYTSIKAMANLRPEDLFQASLLKPLLVNEWLILFFVLLFCLFKAIATSITINSGGNGGNFAPSLLVGASLGYFFSGIIKHSGLANLPVTNFTLVGMAGILSGIFHAPISAIFLIAEITGGYELMIPLMMVSALSYAVVKYIEPMSMENKKLSMKGQDIPMDKDSHVLNNIKTYQLIESSYPVLSPDCSLGEIIKMVSETHFELFPVVDKRKRLVGVIYLDSIREVMFRNELYNSLTASELMQRPSVWVDHLEDMLRVMKKFDETDAVQLPVLIQGEYAGFITRSSVFTRYRNILKNQEND